MILKRNKLTFRCKNNNNFIHMPNIVSIFLKKEFYNDLKICNRYKI